MILSLHLQTSSLTMSVYHFYSLHCSGPTRVVRIDLSIVSPVRITARRTNLHLVKFICIITLIASSLASAFASRGGAAHPRRPPRSIHQLGPCVPFSAIAAGSESFVRYFCRGRKIFRREICRFFRCLCRRNVRRLSSHRAARAAAAAVATIAITALCHVDQCAGAGAAT